MGVAGKKPNLIAQRTGETPDPADAAGSVSWMDAPPDLSERARLIWDLILADLIEAKVFRPADGLLLAELCEAFAMAQGFRSEVTSLQERLARATEAGAEKELSDRIKKARTGYRQAMQTVMSIAGEYGITPVARMRLGLLQLQGNSFLDAWKNRKGES